MTITFASPLFAPFLHSMSSPPLSFVLFPSARLHFSLHSSHPIPSHVIISLFRSPLLPFPSLIFPFLSHPFIPSYPLSFNIWDEAIMPDLPVLTNRIFQIVFFAFSSYSANNQYISVVSSCASPRYTRGISFCCRQRTSHAELSCDLAMVARCACMYFCLGASSTRVKVDSLVSVDTSTFSRICSIDITSMVLMSCAVHR